MPIHLELRSNLAVPQQRILNEMWHISIAHVCEHPHLCPLYRGHSEQSYLISPNLTHLIISYYLILSSPLAVILSTSLWISLSNNFRSCTPLTSHSILSQPLNGSFLGLLVSQIYISEFHCRDILRISYSNCARTHRLYLEVDFAQACWRPIFRCVLLAHVHTTSRVDKICSR